MTCPKCGNSRWIKKEVIVPAHIYGETRTATVAVPCSHCTQPKYLEPK